MSGLKIFVAFAVLSLSLFLLPLNNPAYAATCDIFDRFEPENLITEQEVKVVFKPHTETFTLSLVEGRNRKSVGTITPDIEEISLGSFSSAGTRKIEINYKADSGFEETCGRNFEVTAPSLGAR